MSELAADLVYGVKELDEVLDFFLIDGACVVEVDPATPGWFVYYCNKDCFVSFFIRCQNYSMVLLPALVTPFCLMLFVFKF